MAGGPPIRRAGWCCSSTRGRVTARPHAPGWPSGRAQRGIEAVILASGQDLAALAREAAAAGADALGMAGGGQLGIVVLDAPGDSPHSPGQAWTAPRLEVNAPAPVHAGVDGEAVDLSPPLRFATRPAALRVRICPRHPGASPSARLHLPGYPPA